MANIDPQPGDKLLRPNGHFNHTGIYVDFGCVFHSTDKRGPYLSSLAEFADGKPVTVHPANDADRPAILLRAQIELQHNRVYNLIFNNCQHVTSRAARLCF